MPQASPSDGAGGKPPFPTCDRGVENKPCVDIHNGKDALVKIGSAVGGVPDLITHYRKPSELEGNREKTSRVTYAIEPVKDGVVRLTVTHDELEPDSEMFHSVSFGWPAVVSALKTWLETGTVGAQASEAAGCE